MSGRASSSYSPRSYDIFLSFCGQDTRKSFTDHLFNALLQNGILTFRDDEELKKGEEISAELMAAIENSRIAIIVFSQNYACSTWCLRELARIMDCRRSGRIEKVLPVFYNVDPADIRKQSNIYETAFAGHQERFKDKKEMVIKWRDALTEAAGLSGWDAKNSHEAKLIKDIVEKVSKIMNKTIMQVIDHPVGLGYHIDQIDHLQKDGGSDVVRIIGIYGFGGIGKTTIAMAVFNYLSKSFEGSSFVSKVGEVSREKGFASLQKQLLIDVLKKKMKVNNEYEGVSIIKDRLSCKRVLIVLDNVEEIEQFHKLVGDRASLGLGSLIIVTTRDKHLLTKLEVEEKYSYKVEIMNQNESLQLFSYHAFRQNYPIMDYEQLSNIVVQYVGGLPLALVILGSHLYKASKVKWEKVVKELGKKPNVQIMEILEISYKALDESTQTIFLDISCFFNGKKKNDVMKILDACDLGGEAEIELLTQKSLVEIDEYNQLNIHDLIQEMGREIVCKESPKKPGRRTRLWDYQEAVDVLEELTGTDAVEGFQLNLSLHNKKELSLLLTTEAFSRMPNLRFLMLNSQIEGDNINFREATEASCFKRLNWVCWNGFLFDHIPDGFLLENVVILCMPNSKLRGVWKGSKPLPKLKELDLSGSRDLISTPDLSKVSNLEKLLLKNCESLVEVHDSVFLCSKLETLDLCNCKRLESLPMLPSKLLSLDASGCSELEMLPNVSNLIELRMLKLRGCKKVTELEGLEGLRSVEIINLEGCIKLETTIEDKIDDIIEDSIEDDVPINSYTSEMVLDEDAVPQWILAQSKSKSRDINMGLQPQWLTVCLVFSKRSYVIAINVAEPIGPVIASHKNALTVFELKNYAWEILLIATKNLPIDIHSLARTSPVFSILDCYRKSKNAPKKFGVQMLPLAPHERISRKIFVDTTYNTLPNSYKRIFLDISCFLIGSSRDHIIKFLDACGMDGEAGIELLVEKSLLTIDEDGIQMHDSIRDMGREIVHKQSPENSGGRSRLWNDDDAYDVAINLTGTDAVEGFQLTLPKNSVEEHILLLTLAAFSTMPNLRFLKVCIPSDGNNINFDKAYSMQEWSSCFQNLLWVCWVYFPLSLIPDNFHLGKLVILDMQYSKLKGLWKGTSEHVKMLKVINLSHSCYLSYLPDFSGLPNLEELYLESCTNLVEVHKSIGCLQRLKIFNLNGCKNLKYIPSGIIKLASLEVFNVSFCSKLESFPMLPSRLCYLYASNCCALKRLPNLSNLKKLAELHLKDCKMLTEIEGLEGLESATIINLKGCINIECFIKKEIFQVFSAFESHCTIILIDENAIPEWFPFQSKSDSWENLASVSCQLDYNLPQGRLIICFVCSHSTAPLCVDDAISHLNPMDKTAELVLKWKNNRIILRQEIKYQFDVTQVMSLPLSNFEYSLTEDDKDTVSVSVENVSSGDTAHDGLEMVLTSKGADGIRVEKTHTLKIGVYLSYASSDDEDELGDLYASSDEEDESGDLYASSDEEDESGKEGAETEDKEIWSTTYNTLPDAYMSIFLHISCFFIGYCSRYIIPILDACGLDGKAGIELLIEKYLLTIDQDDRIRMHKSIRDKGREIVHKQSPGDPGGRSRVWNHDDAYDVTINLTGTDAIEGFNLDLFDVIEEHILLLTMAAFSTMPNLRLLRVSSPTDGHNINFDEAHSLQEWSCCFQNLVWLRWKYFPLNFIPNYFHLGKLVILDMPNSKLRELWKGTSQHLTMLQIINFRDSPYLTYLPDVSRLPNLKQLTLKGCTSLVEVHESIRCLRRFEFFNIEGCERLESLPMLPSSLHCLNASKCWALKRLPNLLNLRNLELLNLEGCKMLTEIEGLEGLRFVKTINLKGCINMECFINKEIFQGLSKEVFASRTCIIAIEENAVPEWFPFQSESDSWENLASVSFQLDHNMFPFQSESDSWENLASVFCQLDRNMEMQPQGYLIICFVCSQSTASPCVDDATSHVNPKGKTAELVVKSMNDHTMVLRQKIIFEFDITQVIRIPFWFLNLLAEDDKDTINVSVENISAGDAISTLQLVPEGDDAKPVMKRWKIGVYLSSASSCEKDESEDVEDAETESNAEDVEGVEVDQFNQSIKLQQMEKWETVLIYYLFIAMLVVFLAYFFPN